MALVFYFFLYLKVKLTRFNYCIYFALSLRFKTRVLFGDILN